MAEVTGGVTNQHPDYKRDIPMWQKLRDCYEGEEAVKAKAETYLPRLTDDTDAEYANYLKRANFFPALTRTLEGLVGGVFRIDPIIEFPFDEWKDDVTMTGLDLTQFSKMLTLECALQARAGVLVDWDPEKKRPYAVIYPTENIINWGEDFVVLREEAQEVDPTSDFNVRTVWRWRYVKKLPQGGALVTVYNQAIGQDAHADKADTYTIKPPKSSKSKDFFPFVFVRPTGDAVLYARPPLLGLANTNLSCYMNSADLENGRHLTALPTPWIADDSVKQEVKTDPSLRIKLGSKAAFILEKGGHAGFLEYTGQGLQALEKAIEEKKADMAALGAMMILQQRKQVESSETARIHAAAQTSILSSVVTGTEKGVKKVLDLMLQLANRNQTYKFEVNREFVDVALDPTQVVALVQTWQAGGITHEVLLWNLKKSSFIPPEMSVEDVVKAAEEEFTARQEEQAKRDQATAAAKAAADPGLTGQGGDPAKKVDRRQMDKGAKSDKVKAGIKTP